jgi:acyl-CoA synthetase (AMP-forming)/AMP-acid ligase II
MNIYEKLLEQLEHRPNESALIDTDANSTRYTSYADLVRLIEQGAANLKRKGIGDGDTVLVLQGLSLELYVTLLALFKLGATATIIDPSMPAAALKQCCLIARPKAIVAGTRGMLFSYLNQDVRSIPQRISVRSVMRLSCAPPAPTFDAWPDTPALITFTSGSTAVPKAICRTHQFLLDQHCVLSQALALHAGARQLVTLPVFVLANLASGVTSCLPNTDVRHPGRVNAGAVTGHLERTGVTEILASPAFVERLCDYAVRRSLYKRFADFLSRPLRCVSAALRTSPRRPPLRLGDSFNQVTRVFVGGAPVLPSSYRKITVTFPHATIYGVYGSTEAEPIAKISLPDISADDMHAMSNGAGLLAGEVESSVQLAIVDSDWQPPDEKVTAATAKAKMLGPGQIGEILVAGKHVVKSYMNRECNRESKIVVDAAADTAVWHRTGDAGYIDSAGRLWLLGRVSARIKDEFGVLYPLACEAQVMEQTGVRRAAVVERRHQRVIVVESQDKGEVEALKRIALASNIQRIIFVASLPVDPRHNSKVDYRALHKILDAAS